MWKQVNYNHFYNKISSNYASGRKRVWILKGLIWLSERYMLVSMILVALVVSYETASDYLHTGNASVMSSNATTALMCGTE